MSCELSLDTQCMLYDVKKPYQYIGSEYLSYDKNFEEAQTKIVLAFPDKYEIGISNLGLKILYDRINSDTRFMADRVYAPEVDYRNILSEKDLPLQAVETKKCIKEFDIIGFSLQYELAYPTVLEMMRLAKIEVLREKRNNSDPIIAAGGPCCYNPRPIEDFIDIFMIGDGEELIIELTEKYSQCREKGLRRTEIIKELSQIEGIYSPAYPKRTKKRIYDITKDNKSIKSPVPYSSSIHDRTIIEIRRGCGRMCRFCQAGHINLPIRERKASDIINMVKTSTSITGYDEYSLLSLSSNDYKNIEKVIESLNEEMNKKRISVSLPSQRIDRYSTNLAKLVQGVRATTATLAPEAGSQRLRNVINKNLTEEQIIETILNCYKSGSNHVKLYFMIGLPTETYQDIDEMAELFKKIRYKGKQLKQELNLKDGLNITCTLSIFVPKPFTPFQWFGQNSQEITREKIKYLLEQTKNIKGLKINYHSSFTSKVECALSRGDKKYNKFLLTLHKKGTYLTSWDEYTDKDLWEQTAIECGFNLDEEAQKSFNSEEELPWDIIDTGLEKEWLINQYQNAIKEKNIIPCEFNCVNCGVCKNLKTHKKLDDTYEYSAPIADSKDNLQRTAYKYRLKITKENEMRYISHLDWQNTIVKTLYRSGLSLCFSQGFNPTPKFSLGIALPIFVESQCEFIDIEIYDNLEENILKEKLNKVLPKNIKILSAARMDKSTKAIDIIAQWALYSFTPIKEGILQNRDLVYIKDKISSDNEIYIEKINKKGIKKLVNIKPSIKSVEVEENRLLMVLKTGQSEEIPSVKPEDVIKQYRPEIKFKIVREVFYDGNMNKL